jgi:hypothetical protein
MRIEVRQRARGAGWLWAVWIKGRLVDRGFADTEQQAHSPAEAAGKRREKRDRGEVPPLRTPEPRRRAAETDEGALLRYLKGGRGREVPIVGERTALVAPRTLRQISAMGGYQPNEK